MRRLSSASVSHSRPSGCYYSGTGSDDVGGLAKDQTAPLLDLTARSFVLPLGTHKNHKNLLKRSILGERVERSLRVY
jgi:hypothetical protein